MRILLIVNPAAGEANPRESGRVQDLLGKAGQVLPLQPSRETFAREVKDAAQGVGLVVIAGGDGTFNSTINALRHRLDAFSFALVPMGTGNDLARTLGLPKDPVEAARGLLGGKERNIDVARAWGGGTEQLFANACIGGFPAEIDRAVNEDVKGRLGPLAYWLGGAKAAMDLRRFTATMDEVEVLDCVAAGVGNGSTCGGGLQIWPAARPDDGLLDGCALPASGAAQAARLLAGVKTGKHEEIADVATCRGRRIVISADPDIEFNVDGELVGLRSPATFELVSQIRMRVPRSAAP
jgi:diacylglycerol kinase (ATP)